MGKNKHGHNWKARSQHKTTIDDSETQKIKVDGTLEAGSGRKGIEESLNVVLPAKKRKTMPVREARAARKLSRKERIRLEKIVDRKKKLSRREELLASLIKIQESNDRVKKAALQKTDPAAAGIHTHVNAITGGYRKRKNKRPYPELTNKDDGNDDDNSEGEGSTDTDEVSTDTDDISTDEEEELDSETEHGKNETEQMDTDANNSCSDGKTDDLSKSSQSVGVSKTENSGLAASKIKIERKPAIHIAVNRTSEIQAARLQLPILAEEQMIMEGIGENPAVIICGETGSGKTTQIPQFLYEAGYTSTGRLIGITEPRRVAAVAMSKRVAMELNLSPSVVSYQIRYEGNTSPDTRIKFMTDGVLLKELQQDFLLTNYSAIVIDEAHERSVYTDILIGLLSRIVPLRHKRGDPLKLIIMSATLRIEDFKDNSMLFKIPPPHIKIDARQFPVTVHFNKRTSRDDYVGEALKKVCKIHRQLPPGGILVFVTGQQEVHIVCKKLKSLFPSSAAAAKSSDEAVQETDQSEVEVKNDLPEVDLDDYSAVPLDEEAELNTEMAAVRNEEDDEGMSTGDEEDGAEGAGGSVQRQQGDGSLPLYVLPLYSLLSSKHQARVFEEVPEGVRLCVVATNVAETSLTIPGVKYVVDTGRVKTKFSDKLTGVSTFRVTWTSKASANQRTGRAGRTGPGHCYRLFSSAVFTEEFEEFSAPELTRRPMEDVVLQMKAMHIDHIVNFPFPTPLPEESLLAAQTLLVNLGGLEVAKSATNLRRKKKSKGKAQVATITPLGLVMSHFPVAPRYSKMLSLGHQRDLLPYVIAMVSALSVPELFVEGSQLGGLPEEEMDERHATLTQLKTLWAGEGHSLLLGDASLCLKAVGAAEYATFSSEFSGDLASFCDKHGLRYKAMLEVKKLRVQLTNIANAVFGASVSVDPNMSKPTDEQCRLLRQILLSGMGDHVARRQTIPVSADAKLKKSLKHSYLSVSSEDPVFIHRESALYSKNAEYIVYQSIMAEGESGKLVMRGLAAVEEQWLPKFVPAYCSFGEPLSEPEPRFNAVTGNVMCFVKATYGPHLWVVPPTEISYPPSVKAYKWFAQFLLEGQVIAKMAEWRPLLSTRPSIMNKSWSNLEKKTEVILTALYTAGVMNRESLLKKWAKDEQYLLPAYLQWVAEGSRDLVRKGWPPVDTTPK